MNSKKSGIIENLANAIAAALSPLGLKAADVALTPVGVTVPAIGISVAAELVANRRVWSATETFAVASLDGDEERMQTRVLFQEPLDKQWQVARRLAVLVATRKIDAAIDAAIF